MAKERERCPEPPQHGQRYAQLWSAGWHPGPPTARRGSPSRPAQAATDRDRPRRKRFRRLRSTPKAGATQEDGADVARGFAILVMKTRRGQRRRDRQRQRGLTIDKVGIGTQEEKDERGASHRMRATRTTTVMRRLQLQQHSAPASQGRLVSSQIRSAPYRRVQGGPVGSGRCELSRAHAGVGSSRKTARSTTKGSSTSNATVGSGAST